MSTITENFPFCYAIKNSIQINLYILVKVPANRSITFPGGGNLTGQTKHFDILLANSGDTPGHKYRNYVFDIKEDGQTINLIEIKTKLNGATIKTMKIKVEDLDVVSGSLSYPTTNVDGAALDTPYVCTQLMESPPGTVTGFDAEVYVLPSSPASFSVQHHPPAGTDKDSSSDITASAGTSTELSVKHSFSSTNIHTTDGAHTATFNGRKGKTKNRNHTVTPFPRRVTRP